MQHKNIGLTCVPLEYTGIHSSHSECSVRIIKFMTFIYPQIKFTTKNITKKKQ